MSEPNAFDLAPTTTPRPRRRKLYFLGGLILFFAVAAGGLYLYLGYAAERRWEAAVAEADRNDPNWRLDDLLANRPPIPDAENGALVVITAKKLLPNQWPAWDY